METGIVKKDKDEMLVRISRTVSEDGRVDVSKLEESDRVRCREITKGIKNLETLYSFGTDLIAAKNEASSQLLSVSKIDKADAVGQYIRQVVDAIRDTEYEDPSTMKGFRGFLARLPIVGTSLVKAGDKYIVDRYDTARDFVDKIIESLKVQQVDLKTDYNTLNNMLEKTYSYIDQLGVHYVALSQLYADKEKELEEMRAANTENPGTYSDNQIIAAKNFLDEIYRHQYELFLTGQYNQNILVPSLEKMKTNAQNLYKNAEQISNTVIPNWETSISMALINKRAQKIADSQKLMKDKNNEMILANAKMLENITTSIEKENMRGSIDVETYKEAREIALRAVEKSSQNFIEIKKKMEEDYLEIARINKEAAKKLVDITEAERKYYVDGSEAVVAKALR